MNGDRTAVTAERAARRQPGAKAGVPPDRTLRRAIADAVHENYCGATFYDCPADCEGRIDATELDIIEVATKRWHYAQTAKRIERFAAGMQSLIGNGAAKSSIALKRRADEL